MQNNTDENNEEVEGFRERLQRLVRQLEQFESHTDLDGEPMATSYAQALMVLLDFHLSTKRPTLSDLVDLLGIDKSNVTRLCQKMKRAGHITLERDPDDRRAKRIELSDDGLDLAKHVNDESLERFEQILESFPEASRDELQDWLEQLNSRIAEQLT